MNTSESVRINTNRLAGRTVLLALGLASVSLFSPGCSLQSGETRREPPLLASAPSSADVAFATAMSAKTATARSKIAEELRDPAERTIFMQRMRLQILQKTRHLSDGEYEHARPSLDRQLATMGLQQDEVDFILTDIDGSRPRGSP
jgi:hypothetical protein